MTSVVRHAEALGQKLGREPVVAIISRTPIFCEALVEVLEDIAEVRRFPADAADHVGLLRAVHPDAVVIDAEDGIEGATEFASESSAALLHISLVHGTLRTWHRSGWSQVENTGWSPESIRNALLAELYRLDGDS
ncbi:MAG: hypothetical protein AABM30_10485 [Actinomycetota bacterium]